MKTLVLLTLVVSATQAVDWTEKGRNWNETVCQSGWY